MIQTNSEKQDSRKETVVIFGDLMNFGVWSRRSVDHPDIFYSFMSNIYEMFKIFGNRTNCWMKYEGDGFMGIYEAEKNPLYDVIDIMQSALVLQKNIGSLIHALPFPRPTGFRTRMVYGKSWKIKIDVGDLNQPRIDYVGYSINLASRLLDVHRDIEILVHESCKELVSPSEALKVGLSFTKVPRIVKVPHGIDEEDVDALWMLSNEGGQK